METARTTAVREEQLADLITCGLEVITAIPYAFSSLKLWSQSFVIALGSLWPFVNNKKTGKRSVFHLHEAIVIHVRGSYFFS